MQAKLLVHREIKNRLTCQDIRDPYGSVHFHSLLELCLVNEGEVEALIGDQLTRLKKGELSFIMSYEPHAFHTPDSAQATYLHIPANMCKEFLPLVQKKRVRYPIIHNGEVFDEISGLCRAIREGKNELIVRGSVYLVLGTLLNHLTLEEEGGKMDVKLSTQLLMYLNEHFRENISLSSIGTALGYHPNYLSQYFKSCFHIGLNRYITVLRLREACLMLRDQKKSVENCAYESGFNSVRSFYRAFQAEFHCTPTEYMAKKEG